MKEKREIIKKFILNNYGVKGELRSELSKFLDYLFKDYDIEDKIYEDIKEDLVSDEEDEEDFTSFEIKEYTYNVLGGKW